MKLKTTILATTALTLAAGSVFAQEMADSMTLVSWGGAYQASQHKAYVEPYLEMHPGCPPLGTKAPTRRWPSCAR